MVTFVAFLRGINSGLNPTTKMDVLKQPFEAGIPKRENSHCQR